MHRLVSLPLHLWDRELDSRILLAALAVNAGHDVILGHEYNISPLYKTISNIYYYGAGRPVFDHIRTHSWYEPLISNSGFVGLTFEEGVNDVLHNSPNTFYGITERSLNSTSRVFAWCSKEIEHMKTASDAKFHSILTDISSASSNPRLDLLGLIGERYFKQSIDSINHLFGPYILVSDNFGIELFGLGSTLPVDIKRQEYFKKYAHVSDLNTRQILVDADIDYYLKRLKARDGFASILNQLVKNNPDIHFVFRPHPVADPTYWKHSLVNARNLSIILRHNIVPWIKSTICTIHSGCTVGFESELANKPAIDISSIYNDERFLGLGTSVSRFIPSSLDECNRLIRELAKSKYDQHTSKSVEKNDIPLLIRNLSSLNREVFSNSDVLFTGLPYVSALQEVLHSIESFTVSSESSSNWDSLRNDPESISSLLGLQRPLPGKSRYYSLNELFSCFRSAFRALEISPKVTLHKLSVNNVFLLRCS